MSHSEISPSSKTALAEQRPKKGIRVWLWSPRAIEHRGKRVGREQERAYRDLQAAADAADWR